MKQSSRGFRSSFRHMSTRFWVWFSVKSCGTSWQRLLTFPIALRCRTTDVCGISSSADNLRVLVDGLASTAARMASVFTVIGQPERGSSLRSVCPSLNFLNHFCAVRTETTSSSSTLHIFLAARLLLLPLPADPRGSSQLGSLPHGRLLLFLRPSSSNTPEYLFDVLAVSRKIHGPYWNTV